MVDDDDASSTPVLTYATPPVRGGRPILGALVALLGTGFGLFGGLMLFYGVGGIVFIFSSNENSVDLPHDVFETVMFLLIGLVCLFVGVRWCRSVRGIITGR